MDINHKHRWIFSPLDKTGQPVAREYAIRSEHPFHHNGHALTLCMMNAHMLAAARQDPRLIVLPSIHERTAVHKRVTDHHAEHGAKEGMALHELLITLAKHHPGLEPEW